MSAEALAREAAWGEYRDSPDYQPTDRHDVRFVFDAGFDAGVRNRHRAPISDEEKDRLIRDILTYGHIEGLALEGYVRAAVRMTLEAYEAAEAARKEQA